MARRGLIPQALLGIERIDQMVGAKPGSRFREPCDHGKGIAPDRDASIGKGV